MCLFQGILESVNFKYKLPINVSCFRYSDVILSFLPQNKNIENVAEKLNHAEPSINFTYEKISNNTTPFLHILVIKSKNNLNSKAYRKPTKNDYIHFYSYHNNEN